MKIIKTIAILLLFSSVVMAQNEEYNYLIENIISGEEGGDYIVYRYSKKIKNTDTVFLWQEKINSPFEKSILFFVDDAPLANWTHSCRYIFMNLSNNNDYVIFNSKYPPKNLKYFTLLSDMNIPSGYKYDFSNFLQDSIFKTKSKTTIDGEDSDYGNKYAVIISGGVNKSYNKERYWNDCAAIYSTLKHIYGFEQDKIFVLISDGTNPADDRDLIEGGYDSSPLDLDGDGEDDITHSATKSNVINVFDMLSAFVTPNDFLFVYTIDHGSVHNNEYSTLCLWNEEEINDWEFEELINDINAKKISIIMGQCYSGGFVDKFENIGKDGRIIVSACKTDQQSRATHDFQYDEFVYHWTAAVLGEYPNGITVNADSNNDGFVSMSEAFEYAHDNDNWAYPGPNHSEDPQYYSQPIYLGEQLNLFGFEVDSYQKNETVTDGEQINLFAYNNIIAAGSGSNYKINSGANVNFKAGNAIILKPGFRTISGSKFRAFIEEPFDFPVFKIEGNFLDLYSKNNINSNKFKNIQLIENDDKTQSISVYPNPTNGILYIYNETHNITKVEVYSYNGVLLLNKNLKSPKFVIDLKSQPDGIYLLKIIYGKNNNIVTKKIIKQ
ncbi:MAG: T9SS type A sorting domain-containing protein [Bacteroidota bacterium]|nr:T9SS type A sorting domain-containing protein [Bacteroidota bacterium]